MQRIYFEKWIDLNHELTELLSLSVDESINYKIESVGVRAIGSLIVKGEYNDGKKFHDDVDMDVLATFDKIVDQRDFNIKVEDFDYHLVDGNLSLIIQAYVYGVLDDEDRVVDTVTRNEEVDPAEEIEKLLREEEKIVDVSPETKEVTIQQTRPLKDKQVDMPVQESEDVNSDEDLGTYYFYVVQDGDSYETIARHYKVDEYALKQYNHERSLTQGTIVIIPYMICHIL